MNKKQKDVNTSNKINVQNVSTIRIRIVDADMILRDIRYSKASTFYKS